MGLQYQVYSNENVYCDLCEAIKVSIIVAVYNVEMYLERCLESLVNQTLKDIEIICINDASTDGSGSLLRKYEKKDERIRVIELKKNLGAANARNQGIDTARGKYILVVDADDYLEIDAASYLYEKSEHIQADMCFFRAYIHNKTGVSVPEGIIGQYESVYSGKELLEIFAENKEFFLYACLVMFKREFLDKNNLRYRNLKVGEGGDLNTRAIYMAKRVIVDDKEWYHYCVNQNSVTHQKDSKLQTVIGQYGQYVELLKIFANDTMSEALYKYLKSTWNKVAGGIQNLSIEQKKIVEASLRDKFAMHMFEACTKDNYYIKDFSNGELQAMQHAEKIMLYGTGYATGDVINLINNYGIEIAGFVVSDKSKSPKALYGHRVYEITELDAFNKDILIVVTANKRHQREIKEILEELEFVNIIMLDIRI